MREIAAERRAAAERRRSEEERRRFEEEFPAAARAYPDVNTRRGDAQRFGRAMQEWLAEQDNLGVAREEARRSPAYSRCVSNPAIAEGVAQSNAIAIESHRSDVGRYWLGVILLLGLVACAPVVVAYAIRLLWLIAAWVIQGFAKPL